FDGLVNNRQVVDDYQQKAAGNIEEVLAPVLGNGNYRISVAADFDFAQREETRQAYGDTPRLRNEMQRNESSLDQLALGVPGSLSNLPPKKAEDGEQQEVDAQGNPAATSLREETTRKLDYDQSVTHVKHAPFALRQQSIAVVLNAASAPEGGWTKEARAELEATIKSAVGFNVERGDSLTLSVFPFAGTAEVAPEVLPWWESRQVHELAKLGVFGLISLLLLLIVVRPALRNLTHRAAVPMLTPAENEAPPVPLVGERNEPGERVLARVGENAP